MSGVAILNAMWRVVSMIIVMFKVHSIAFARELADMKPSHQPQKLDRTVESCFILYTREQKRLADHKTAWQIARAHGSLCLDHGRLTG